MAFDTESGLFSNYEGEIIQASFGFDPRVNNGETLCFFPTMKTDSNDPAFSEWNERYKCGGGWTTHDGGETAYHPDMERNPDKKFNKNSQMGQFIEAIKKCDGAVQALSSRGDEFHAATYVGSKWKMKPVSGSFTDQDTKERVEYERNYPAAFLGYSTGAGNGSGGTAASVASSVELDEEKRSQLQSLAKSEGYQVWSDKALDLLSAEIKIQPSLLSAIGNENGLYTELRNS